MTSAATPPRTMETAGPLQKLALLLVGVYLFIIVSRMFDVMFSRLRIPMVVFCLMVVAALVAGNKEILFRSRTVKVLTMWIIWLAVATVFSTWPGGSAEVFQTCFTSYVFALSIMTVVTQPEDAIRLMRTIGYAILLAALLSFVLGTRNAGRLTLYQGTYGDPNEFALGLLMGLPYWLLMGKQAVGIKKLIPWTAAAVVFTVFMQTGSRGGAIGLIAMMTVFFFQTSGTRKLLIVIASIFMLFAAALFLPDYLRTRFLTLFSVNAERAEQLDDRFQEQLSADAGSATGRLELLMDSIRWTARHPLLGVGPNQFAQQRWEEKRVHSILNPGSLVTHNSYTQLSSETGVFGLVLLLVLLYGCFKAARLIIGLRQRPEYQAPERVIDAAAYHRLALTSIAACTFFLSVAYSQLYWIMAGLTAAFYHAVERKLPSWKAPAPAPPPEPGAPPGSAYPPAAGQFRFGRSRFTGELMGRRRPLENRSAR